MKKIYYCFLFCFTLLLGSTITAQTVTTLGTGIGIDDALIFDKDGNLFGSAYGGDAIYKMTPDHTFTTFSSGFNTPNGLAFGNDGTLYMADNEGNKIYKIDADGVAEPFIDDFFNPSGLIFLNGSDTLIATSYRGNIVSKVTPDSTVSDFSIALGYDGPVGMCYGETGILYVANFNDGIIFKLNSQGIASFFAQPPGGSIGFITCTNGYLYTSMINDHKIYRISEEDGTVEYFLGSDRGSADGDAATAKFNGPNGILASQGGDSLFVSEFSGGGTVRLITNLEGSTAVNEQLKQSLAFRVSPNLAVDQAELSFNLESSQQVKVTLLDRLGKRVREIIPARTLNRGLQKQSIELSDLSPGMYFALLELEERYMFVEQIIIVD